MTEEPMIILDLGVGGMTCDDCVRTVSEALQGVPGVVEAQVSLTERSATVRARASVVPDALTAAVRARGYNAFVRRRRQEG
jgi:copper chaperone